MKNLPLFIPFGERLPKCGDVTHEYYNFETGTVLQRKIGSIERVVLVKESGVRVWYKSSFDKKRIKE